VGSQGNQGSQGQTRHLHTAASLAKLHRHARRQPATLLRAITRAEIALTYRDGMTRPLRLEYAGSLYHVTSRGDRRGAIFCDDKDRMTWLNTIELVCERFNFTVHAYCQMTNHYHLIVEGNLSHGMQQLNGLYSQAYNRHHGLAGHVFQGRFEAILVQKEGYLLELSRYIVLNPLRAGMVESLDAWPWSSHHILLGAASPPPWFDADWLLGQFGTKHSAAVEAYRQLILDGVGVASPMKDLRHQLLLGDDAFVDRHQFARQPETLREVTKAERRAVALPLASYQEMYSDRDEAMAMAYRSTAYSMLEIGRHFGVSDRTVGRAVRKFEKRSDKN
jgi:putative transposase